MPSVAELAAKARAAKAQPPPTAETPPSVADLAAKARADALRTPPVRTSAIDNDIQTEALRLRDATITSARTNGVPEDEAIRRGNEAYSLWNVVGPGANRDGIEDALAAHYGPPTVRKAFDMAFGPRVVKAEVREPTQGEKDEAYRSTVRFMGGATSLDAVGRALAGEEAPAVSEADAKASGVDKPWLQRNAGVLAGALSGGLLPMADTVAHLFGHDIDYVQIPGVGKSDIVSVQEGAHNLGEYLQDPDVHTIAAGMGPVYAATGLIQKSGLGKIAGEAIDEGQNLALHTPGVGRLVRAAADATGMTPGHAALWWDDASSHDAFDTAASDWYATGDRSKIAALPYDDLPARLQGKAPDTQWIARYAADHADDPEFAPVRDAAGKSDAYLDATVRRLPLATLQKAQIDLVPSDDDLRTAVKARDDARGWGGGKQGEAFLRLMGAGLIKPVDDGKSVVFVPSRLADVMRIAGTAGEMVGEADVPIGAAVALPAALPLGLALLTGTDPGKLYAKLKSARLPTKAGLEFMVQSGAWDDALEAMGLQSHEKFAALRDPESTWTSRVLANVTQPEHEGMIGTGGYADLYTRAGGNPDSATAKALATASLAGDFLLPAEHIVGMPITSSLAAASRARAAMVAAREAGLAGREVRMAMLAAAAPRLVGGETDGIAALNKALKAQVRDGLETGRLNPDLIKRSDIDRVVDLFREAGVKEPEKYVDTLMGVLRDRHARILDATSEIQKLGGPATKRLRASTPYMDRARELDEMVRRGNLSPRDRDLQLRMLESAAFAAHDRGAVASPEEFFARHEWRPGTEGERLGEGTLYAERVGIAATDRPQQFPGMEQAELESRLVSPAQEVLHQEAADLAGKYEVGAQNFDGAGLWDGGPENMSLMAGEAEVPNARAFGAAWTLARKQDAVALFRSASESEPATHIFVEAALPHDMSATHAAQVLKAHGVQAGTVLVTEGRPRLLIAVDPSKKPAVDAALAALREQGATDITYADGIFELIFQSDAPQILREFHGEGPETDKLIAALTKRGIAHADAYAASESGGLGASEAATARTGGEGGEAPSAPGPRRTPRPAPDQPILRTLFGGAHEEVAAAPSGLNGGTPQPGTAEFFRRWFGNSKAVDEQGNPKVFYHGTSSAGFDTFDAYGSNHGLFGQGIYVTDSPEIASEYTAKGKGTSPGVYPLYVRVENPIDMDAVADLDRWRKELDARNVSTDGIKPGMTNEQVYRAVEQHYIDEGYPKWDAAQEIQDILRGQGYDGITHVGGGRVRSEGPRHRVYIVFDPEQVKSAIGNEGSFDPNDPNILWEREGDTIKGAITPTARTKVIQNPDRKTWEDTGRAARKEVADLQRQADTLAANPAPHDPDWARDLDDVRERLAAAQERLSTLRKARVPKTITVADAPGYILRLFRTGDARTAFHEAAHLLDLILGDEWTTKAAKALGFTDEQIRDPANTVAIRERIAEAGTRMLRGTLRPGSRLGNVMEDAKDALTDLWARVRSVPQVAPPEFRAWWDATLRPDEVTRPTAVALVDERLPRDLNRPVFVGDDVAEEVADNTLRKVGQARQANRVDRAGAEIRALLGLQNGQPNADPIDLLTNALAHIATEKYRRRWGNGELVALTTRTAVPAARAEQVRRTAEARRAATIGGLPTPKDGRLLFDPPQARGFRRLLDEIAASPVGDTLPTRLRDPDADLSAVTLDEWNTVQAHLLDLHAGAGAWREQNAERAATSGALRLWSLAINRLERTPTGERIVNAFRDAFVVSHATDHYTAPAVRDVIRTVERRLAAVGRDFNRETAQIVRDLKREGKTDFTTIDILRRVSQGMGPEVVPVADLEALSSLAPLVDAKDVPAVAERVDDLHRLFTNAPIRGEEQTLSEVESVTLLDRIAERMKQGRADVPAYADVPEAVAARMENGPTVPPTFEQTLRNLGITEAQANDAMAIVMEGLRRRTTAVSEVGAAIYKNFGGSMDKANVAAIPNPRVMFQTFSDAYRKWYAGDWGELLADIARTGGAASGADYDQGSAALSTILRLKARGVLSAFSEQLARVGIAGDTADIAKGGLRFDRHYTLGTLPGGREAHIRDVAGYIRAITGWTDTPTEIVPTKPWERNVTIDAKGRLTVDGIQNPAAYADAQRILSQWGFRYGKGLAWSRMDLPGGRQILVPDLVREPIEDVIRQASLEGRAFGRRAMDERVGDITPGATKAIPLDERAIEGAVATLSKTWEYTFGMLKTGLTTGLIVPRPAFYIGNALGGAFQLYQRLGAAEALKIMSRPLMPTADGAVMRRVLLRLWKDGEGVGGLDLVAPPRRGFFARDGRWWDDQSVAEAAQQAGLNTSQAKHELAAGIVRDLQNRIPNWSKYATPAILADNRWQRALTEASTATDNYYRVATFVELLRQGHSADDAAAVARDATFDYGALTDFEKNRIAPFVLFYAFQRRNQDLFWHTFLTNPHRILGQLRLAHGMEQYILNDDTPEMLVPDYLDGRLLVRLREMEKDTQIDRSKRGVAIVTPKLPGIGDGIGLWLDLLGAASGDLGSPEARNVAGRLHPALQGVFTLATGQDIHTGKDLDDYDSVPNTLVELDRNLTGGRLVDGLFHVHEAAWRDDSQAPYPGAPRYQIGSDTNAQTAWWIFRNASPGGMLSQNIEQMQRADVGSSVIGEHGLVQAAIDATRKPGAKDVEEDSATTRPGLTPMEEYLTWLGVRAQPIDDRAEVIGKLKAAKAGDLRVRGNAVEGESAAR